MILRGRRDGIHQLTNEWMCERWLKLLPIANVAETLLIKLSEAELLAGNGDAVVTLGKNEMTVLASLVADEVVRLEKEGIEHDVDTLKHDF